MTPKVYVFVADRCLSGDMVGAAMAEDGTVLGRHICSNESWLRHDLHDRPAGRSACEAHYPDGYDLVVLPEGEVPPMAEMQGATT